MYVWCSCYKLWSDITLRIRTSANVRQQKLNKLRWVCPTKWRDCNNSKHTGNGVCKFKFCYRRPILTGFTWFWVRLKLAGLRRNIQTKAITGSGLPIFNVVSSTYSVIYSNTTAISSWIVTHGLNQWPTITLFLRFPW